MISLHPCIILIRHHHYILFFNLPLSPLSTLFPYTTLFRSSPSPARRRGRTAARSAPARCGRSVWSRSEEHTSELQSLTNLVCRLLLEKKKHDDTVSDSMMPREFV